MKFRIRNPRFNILINQSNQGSETLYPSDIILIKKEDHLQMLLYINKFYVLSNLIIILFYIYAEKIIRLVIIL